MAALPAWRTPPREPRLSEPSCGQCHGRNYSTGADLYRHARGHGGLYCAACHNSPHAWWPFKKWADNVQPMKLQHSTAPIGDCSVCHTNKLNGTDPHVTISPAVKQLDRTLSAERKHHDEETEQA